LDETRIEYSQNFNFMVNFDRGKSQITGKVYIDENMNARNEDSEEGVAGVVLTLSDGRTTTSNKYGIYKFEGLLPGSYSMELKSPDNSVELIDESAKNIDMQANQRRMLNFAVARSQKISGYVYMDENGNGQKDDLELVFPDVRISAGEDNATKTDREGYYEFSGTMLNRNAVLQIDITTLPEGFRLAGDRKTKADKNGEYNFTVIKSQLINLDKEDKKLLQEEKKDDFIQIISIKPLAKGQTLFSAKLMKDIDAVYVNDKAVKIKDSYFQATVPNNIKQAKIKFFDKNKKFWVKYYKY